MQKRGRFHLTEDLNGGKPCVGEMIQHRELELHWKSGRLCVTFHVLTLGLSCNFTLFGL